MLLPWSELFARPHPGPLRTVFFGTPEIAVPTLEWIASSPDLELCAVVSQPARRAGRGRQQRQPPVAVCAEQLGVPLYQPEKLSLLRETLLSFAPQLLIVFAFGRIFPDWLLRLPTIAPLNVHASLLPRHRGAAPIQAAILAGDDKSGLTLMGMDREMDAGPMLWAQQLPLTPGETAGSLHDRLAVAGPTLLAEGVAQICTGSLDVQFQDEELVTFAPKLDGETARIDWHASCEDVDRRVRAMSPFPGAYTELPDGGRLKILAGTVSDLSGAPPLKAGEVWIDETSIYVGTGGPPYRILRLQPANKRPMAAADYLRGNPVAAGTLLEP